MPHYGSTGVDYSANPPSLSGKSLLATIPADQFRLGYYVQNQDAADSVYVVYDHASDTQSIYVLASSTTLQGGAVDMRGMPHSGRVRIYGDHSTTAVGARSW